MRMEIYLNDTKIYSYGEELYGDKKLIEMARFIDETDSIIMMSNYNIFMTSKNINKNNYNIFILAEQTEEMSGNLKAVIILDIIILILAVFSSIFITNRILIKFIFKKIEEPLNILITGVHEIGGGNLEHRITYKRKDEFQPVCEAFNEMAVRLKESVERTKRNEESRKELMAGISHDLRSPLTSIKAYVEGLLDGIAETPQARQSYLTIIKRKADDINRMVSQIFTFSKLELEEYPIELSTIQLDFEIKQLVCEYTSEYEKQGLILSIQHLTPYIVKIDCEQFYRVILNIIDNSLKYRSKEIGRLYISLNSLGEYCELCLTDDGPGVPDEALPKLFDVFYRSDPARKNPAGGSGLGLAIAAKTIERLNGTIRAENADNKGLSIIITLYGKDGTLYGKNTDY